MPDFRIYYDGDTTYDGDPYNAPGFGVLAIIQKDSAHGRKLIINDDYFVWLGSGWMGVDWIGMIDYLQQPGPRKVIFGRMVEREYFYEVAGKAETDRDFPPRTAWHKDEIRI